MSEDLQKIFSPLIAYVLPGLVVLYGLSFYIPVIAIWFGSAAEKETTIGGFFFVLLASLGIGLVVSGLRCLVIDEYCMPKAPAFNYGNRGKEDTERALADVRANHYVYYQFYSNTLCSVVVTTFLWHHVVRPPWLTWLGLLVAVFLTCVVLFFSAKDCLIKYDQKTKGILGVVPPARRDSA